MDDRPILRSLGITLEAWRALMGRLTAADLALATPNPGWDVADVIGHSIAVTRKFAAFAAGATDRPRTPEQGLSGDDHRAAFDDAAAEALAAWRGADPRRQCHLPFGTFPAELAAGINLFDLLAHGWDIRQATGAAFDCPDEVWSAGLDAARRTVGEHRSPEHYAPALPVEPDASAETRFLRYLGRRAVHVW
ncbi:TIGR03086 family metal-binding protein [Actinomadura sp. NPDC048394]|uniref:TIGR03086 family metal-binding protein n=1 Tax=Actinomadura sp. NPDC048394 TaxID=3158223 RepID=UPI0033CCE142